MKKAKKIDDDQANSNILSKVNHIRTSAGRDSPHTSTAERK